MKKNYLLLVCMLLGTIYVNAAVSKTIEVTTAGTLSSLLTPEEKTTITDFTVTGTINISDVRDCLRDEMTALAVLDLSGVNIAAYSYYPANEMPEYSFNNGVSGKTTLTHCTLPSSITSVGISAFENCSNLTGTLTLPNSVTNIGEFAFAYCSSLSGVLIIPDAVASIGRNAFYQCTGFTGSLTLPSSISTISFAAFARCSGFTGSLTIHNSVSSIDEYAFYNCSGIINILVENSVPPSIASNTFEGINKSSCVLEVPLNAKTAYEAADYWKDFTNISETITTENFIPVNNKLKVYTIAQNIIVENTNQKVQVYDLRGNCIANTMMHSIAVPNTGLYIVKVGDETHKVVVR